MLLEYRSQLNTVFEETDDENRKAFILDTMDLIDSQLDQSSSIYVSVLCSLANKIIVSHNRCIV